MCLAVPLKILSIEGKTAVGEAAGLRQAVRVDFIPDLQGFAIQKLTEEQARENLECIREAVDAL